MTIKEAAEFYNKGQEEIAKTNECIDNLLKIYWHTQENPQLMDPLRPNDIPVPKYLFEQVINQLKSYMALRTLEFNIVIDGKED